jgi:hypothetical protein
VPKPSKKAHPIMFSRPSLSAPNLPLLRWNQRAIRCRATPVNGSPFTSCPLSLFFDSDSGKSSAGRCRNWSGELLILKLNFRMRWSMFSGGMPPFSNSKPRCRFLSPSVHARSCPARCWHVAFLKAQHPQVFAGQRCRIKHHWCLTRQGSCSSTAAASFNCCCQEAVIQK